MEDGQQIGRLEEAVAKLLEGYSDMKEQRDALMVELTQSREEIVQLQQTVQSLKSDKELVQEKVNALINSIESWEKSQHAVAGSAEGGQPVEQSEPVAGSNDTQQQMFSMEG